MHRIQLSIKIIYLFGTPICAALLYMTKQYMYSVSYMAVNRSYQWKWR